MSRVLYQLSYAAEFRKKLANLTFSVNAFAYLEQFYIMSATRGTRTPHLLLRRQLLYPDELVSHIRDGGI